jgi:KaiC/GvpD/RAD55 family RecA-like ATPase
VDKEPKVRIPIEVYQFFTSPGGHSLIVRGMAGTGKTTFALQTIEELSAVNKSFYHSTRVSDSSLLKQFPWLKEKLTEGDSAYIFSNDSAQYTGSEQRASLRNLKGLKDATLKIPMGGEMSISIGKDLGDLESLYRGIEKNLPEKSLVVIDSIDALAQKYDLTCRKILTTIQTDVVEGYGANVMFVLESSDTELDYLGDGVINFTRTEYNRRRLRELEILKLRGCEIQQPKYIYTLDEGRIQTFGYQRILESVVPSGPWKPIPDVNNRISSGITDLDVTLNGGLESGSITAIELGPGVPTTVSMEMESSLVANFVSQGRGVLWVPFRKASSESARARIIQSVPEASFDRQVRMPEKADQMSSSGGSYVLPIEGSNAFFDFKWQNIEYALGNSKKPILFIMGMDTMQALYGNDLYDQLMDFLTMVRKNNGIFVALIPPSSGSANRLTDLATTHLRVDRIGGTVLIYGEEPFTGCYALQFDKKEVGGNVSFTLVV